MQENKIFEKCKRYDWKAKFNKEVEELLELN